MNRLDSSVETKVFNHHMVYSAYVFNTPAEARQLVEENVLSTLDEYHYHHWLEDAYKETLPTIILEESITIYYPDSPYTHAVSIIHTTPYCKISISIYKQEEYSDIALKLKNLLQIAV